MLGRCCEPTKRPCQLALVGGDSGTVDDLAAMTAVHALVVGANPTELCDPSVEFLPPLPKGVGGRGGEVRSSKSAPVHPEPFGEQFFNSLLEGHVSPSRGEGAHTRMDMKWATGPGCLNDVGDEPTYASCRSVRSYVF